MVKKKKENAFKEYTRRTLYLPDDVYAWLKEKGQQENRNVSNYLTSMVRGIKDSV